MIYDGKQAMWVGRNNPRFPYARYGYLPALDPQPAQDLITEPIREMYLPSSRQVTLSNFDLKWRVREIGNLERRLEAIDRLSYMLYSRAEKGNYPINLVKLNQADWDKQECRQWDAIRQLENRIIHIKNLIMEMQAKKKKKEEFLYE